MADAELKWRLIMTEYKPGPAKGEQAPNLGIEIIDVLMRGLATTKERLESGAVLASGRVCIGWYVDHDHSCALWYSSPQ